MTRLIPWPCIPAIALLMLGLSACGDDEQTEAPAPPGSSTSAPDQPGDPDRTLAGTTDPTGTGMDSSTGPVEPTNIFLDIDIGHACSHYGDPPRPIQASDNEFGDVPVIDSTHVLYLVDLPPAEDGLRTGWIDLQIRRTGHYALFSDVVPETVRLYALDGTEIRPVRERREVRACSDIGWYMAWPLTEGTFPIEVVFDGSADQVRLLLEEV